MCFKEFSGVFDKYFHLFEILGRHSWVVFFFGRAGTYFIMFFPFFFLEVYPGEGVLRRQQAGSLAFLDQGEAEHKPSVGMSLALVRNEVAQGVEDKLLAIGVLPSKLHRL